jgi:hypothetical protein
MRGRGELFRHSETNPHMGVNPDRKPGSPGSGVAFPRETSPFISFKEVEIIDIGTGHWPNP